MYKYVFYFFFIFMFVFSQELHRCNVAPFPKETKIIGVKIDENRGSIQKLQAVIRWCCLLPSVASQLRATKNTLVG